MKKEFLPYNTVRNNAIKLAHQILKDGFVPDVIYISLRGGAYIGNVISEYFKIVRMDRHPVFYAAVVSLSYVDVNQQQMVQVDGWTYNPEYLRHGDRVLLVDDIFDSGRTVNHLVGILMEKGIPRGDVKIAVHDYKIRRYYEKQLDIQPDYFCRKLVIDSPNEDIWIHYLSHELQGLTDQERQVYYSEGDGVLLEALKALQS